MWCSNRSVNPFSQKEFKVASKNAHRLYLDLCY